MPIFRQKILVWAVFLVAVIALLVPVCLVEKKIMAHTDGNLILPRDESFINVDVSKNLAFYGVWGLSKFAFQPAASSLAYPILLTPFFFIAGAHLLIPIIINTIIAIFLILVLQSQLIARNISLGVQLTILLLFIYLIPLPLLIISGTEYTLFFLLTAMVIKNFLNISVSRHIWTLCLYGALLVATRYEGLLVIAAICGVLLYQRQTGLAVKVGVTGILPILLFGTLSLSKKGHFVPLTLLRLQDVQPYLATAIGGLLILAIMTVPRKFKIQWITYGVLGVLAVIRTSILIEKATQTSITTWRQQIQIARFIHRYYLWDGISLNQLGAISWFSEGRKVDFTGLANQASPRLSVAELSPDSLSYWLEVSITILKEDHFESRPGGRWDKIASWKIEDEFVSFYAADTSWGNLLKEHMKEYAKKLPDEVHVKYY